ncbi:MAG: UDP-N-acetylmuramate dehydrogenase [Clostridia bacterium]|nr:UDP-N-acetylmuramate dehydrogenase [Clostridia bacterium]
MREIFEEILGKENVFQNEPMKNHTTFKIGGSADWFLMPQNKEQLTQIIAVIKEAKMPFFVLGNGSNLLVGDKGIRGVVICLGKQMDNIEIFENECYVESGALLSKVANYVQRQGLSGLEFASGIPGSIGGAVFMNAGAYEHEIKEVIKSVEYMDKNGEIFTVSNGNCDFGYRTSLFSKNDYIVLGCTLTLKADNPCEIRKRMDDYTSRRTSKQPLEKPSAGSVFKRPVGYFAGALIEQSGLKGYGIGGAQVSQKHAGFIINTGNATAKDVLDLIEYIQKVVLENFGVTLETEVKMIGEF